MSGYDDDWHREHQTEAMSAEIYDEIAAGMKRAMGWGKPETHHSVAMDDMPCRFCAGTGVMFDDNPYGGRTACECAFCAGTGKRASLTPHRILSQYEGTTP